MADEVLSYSDLIRPDNSIDKAIRDLESLGSTYSALTQQVKQAATEIKNALRASNAATEEGRKRIEATVESANSLYNAYNSLKRQITEVGKAEEYFAQKSGEVSRETKLTYQQANVAADSYKALEAKLRELTNSYKSLSAAEREDLIVGQTMAKQIIGLEKELQAINNTIKVNSSGISNNYKSYNYLQAELDRLIAKYKSLSETEVKDPLIGGSLLFDIKAITTELGKLKASLKEATTPFKDTQAGSIDDLRERLNNLTQSYNKLGTAEREDINIGGLLAIAIQNTRAELDKATSAIDNKNSQTSNSISLQDKLNNAMAEYQRIMASVDSTSRDSLSTSDTVARDTGALKAYNKAINEQIRIKQLEAAAAAAQEGSYRQLDYTYQALTLKIKNMSTADAQSAALKEKLIQEARLLRDELKKQDEALGNYQRSVGNYGLAWNGLNHEVSQLIRELPNAGISARTFFMAISNNVPMFVEQLQNAKRHYNDLIAAGQKAVPVSKQIVKAIFSWQTALVVVLTLLVQYGQDIVDWFEKLIFGRKNVQDFSDALYDVSEELQKNIKTSGKAIITFKTLSYEWKQLRTEAEKLQWIKDNQAAFKELDANIRSTADAENAFNLRSDLMVKALKARAKAAAAASLAVQRYSEALSIEMQIQARDPKNIYKHANLDKLKNRPLSAKLKSTWQSIKNFFADDPEDLEYEKTRLEKEAEQLQTIQKQFLDEAEKYFKEAEIEPYHEKNSTTGKGRGRDNENTIYKRYLEIQKKYEESVTALERDESEKRIKIAIDETAAKVRALENTYRENEKILAGQDKRYAKLSAKQREMVEQMQSWITSTIENYMTQYNYELDQLNKDQLLATLSTARETINLKLASLREGSSEEYKLRLQLLRNERKAALIENSKLAENERQAELDIILKFAAAIDKLTSEQRIKLLEASKNNYEQQLSLVSENSEKELSIKLAQLDIEEKIALEKNKMLDKSLQTDEALIKASYTRRRKLLSGSTALAAFDTNQQADAAEFNARTHSQAAINRFALKQEKARWEKQIELAEQGSLDWGDAQFRIAKAELKRINRELKGETLLADIGEHGLLGGLLGAIGFDEDAIDAIEDMTNTIIEQIESIVDAEIEAAEAAVEAAEERVSAAQSAYDAEVEARNNGYANSVATAKKELDNEKKMQQEKQKLLEAAQRKQAAIESAQQASSLITASANIWSSFSSLGIAGPILAAIAIASMWASFIASKVKAKQLTSQSDTYGEGGLEFLEGGSHTSGNDINLGTKNSKGKTMRAEGGEALAIINKRKTRKYRKVLPDIIDSLNRGIFEDKYLNAFNNPDNINLELGSNNINLSKLEDDVNSIKKANEVKYYTLSNGNIIIVNKNVKRTIRN